MNNSTDFIRALAVLAMVAVAAAVVALRASTYQSVALFVLSEHDAAIFLFLVTLLLQTRFVALGGDAAAAVVASSDILQGA